MLGWNECPACHGSGAVTLTTDGHTRLMPCQLPRPTPPREPIYQEETPTVVRVPVQVAALPGDEKTHSALVVLCNDHTIWVAAVGSGGWIQLNNVPQPE